MELLDPVQQAAPQGDTLSAHYEVRRLLGEGGFGHVYEAWDAKLCRSVALKRLKQQTDMLHPEKLLNEARLAASLRHAAFVRIFSIDGDGKSQSIVMELVEGQTLGQVMHAAPMSLDTALDIVCQIADAMDEAHAMDLVHGDLKPSNLMLEANGKVRILDFGLARQLDPQATQTTLLCDLQGTIAYMAPERLMGRLPDTRGDIYALGAMLYEMLAGQRPFAHLNGLALAAAHLQSNAVWPALPATVPPAIAALVRSMTAHDPLERPRTMRDICEVIQAQQQGSALPAPQAMEMTHVKPPASIAIRLQVPVKLTLFAVGAIAVLALAAWQVPELIGRTGNQKTVAYSEMTSMQSGMEALRTFDRDTSQARAIEEFTKVLAHNPANAAAAAGLSLAFSLRYMGNGRDDTWLQRADVSARQALENDSQLALSHVAQAWVRELQGKREEALQEATTALNLEPHNLLGLYGKARQLIYARQYDLATQILATAMAAYPKEHLFHALQGKMYVRQGEYIAAEQSFRHCIKMDPESSGSYAGLSLVLQQLDRNEEALQVLQQGLQIRPHWELYNNLGTLLFAKADYLGAVRAFEDAVSANKGSPGDYLLWANLADAQRWVPSMAAKSIQSYQRAVALLTPLLERSPENINFLSRMALYQARVMQKQQALISLKKALALPETAATAFRAALTFYLIGQRNEAVDALQKAVRLGYPLHLIESEPDLLTLRRDARYQQFIINLESERRK